MAEILIPNQPQITDTIYIVTTFLPSNFNPEGVIATLPVFEDRALAELFAQQHQSTVSMMVVPAGLKRDLAKQFNVSRAELENIQNNVNMSEKVNQSNTEEEAHEVSDSSRDS